MSLKTVPLTTQPFGQSGGTAKLLHKCLHSKQGSILFYFMVIFGMTWLGHEPRTYRMLTTKPSQLWFLFSNFINSVISLEPQIQQSVQELSSLLAKVKGAGQVSLSQPSQRTSIQQESDMILRPLMDLLEGRYVTHLGLYRQTDKQTVSFIQSNRYRILHMITRQIKDQKTATKTSSCRYRGSHI